MTQKGYLLLKIFLFFLIIPHQSCRKTDNLKEALKLDNVEFLTTLKNHTPGVDYIVTGENLKINATLIIEAGVEIVFKDGSSFVITDSGKIITKGTEKNPVVLEGENGHGWKGISFNSSKGNDFNYTYIKDAGLGGIAGASVELNDLAELTLKNVTVSNSKQSCGFLIGEKSKLNVLEGCKITQCYAAFQHNLNTHLTLPSSLQCNQNEYDAIMLKDDRSPYEIEVNISTFLPKQTIAYFIPYSLKVNNCTFTVEAGTHLIMGNDAYITTDIMSGSNKTIFNFLGNRSAPITIESTGNRNWGGISLFQGNSYINYTNIRNVQTSDKIYGAVTLSNKASLFIENCIFSGNKTQCAIVKQGVCSLNSTASMLNTFLDSGRICNY